MENNKAIASSIENAYFPRDAVARSNENEQLVHQAIKRHTQPIPSFFNPDEKKVVMESLRAELQQGFEHRKNSLGMILQTRLDSIREVCQHLLITGQTNLNKQRAEFFGQMYCQMEKHMDHLTANFLQEMDQRFKQMNLYENDYIRNKERQRLEESIDHFLNMLEQIMDDFRQKLSENVKQHDELENTSSSQSNKFNHEQQDLMDILNTGERNNESS